MRGRPDPFRERRARIQVLQGGFGGRFKFGSRRLSLVLC